MCDVCGWCNKVLLSIMMCPIAGGMLVWAKHQKDSQAGQLDIVILLLLTSVIPCEALPSRPDMGSPEMGCHVHPGGVTARLLSYWENR
jgi:hypothetical protein